MMEEEALLIAYEYIKSTYPSSPSCRKALVENISQSDTDHALVIAKIYIDMASYNEPRRCRDLASKFNDMYV